MESLKSIFDETTNNIVEILGLPEDFKAEIKEAISEILLDEEEEEYRVAEDDILNELLDEGNVNINNKKKRRYRGSTNISFWETQWGQMICHPNVQNPLKREGKLFRRRFRLPFPVFQFLVELCTRHNVFLCKYKCRIPIQAKILGCLRILARGNCADDVNELSNSVMGESTVNAIFTQFVTGMTTHIYPCFVKFPQGDLLTKILEQYAAVGLPGCVGSMDCTHIKWFLCPKKERHNAIGKEGFPTIAFQVCVDHSKRVLSVSQHFLGNINDKTICKNDLFSLGIMHGALKNIKYQLWDASGKKYNCQGGYIIVDGGYIDHICFIDPDKHRLTRDEVLFAEWLESVRKDVECFFGILKIRWRLFLNAICYHSTTTMEFAFKTACCLHNMILVYDETIHQLNVLWENVDWATLHPDGDDIDDEIDDVDPMLQVVIESTDTAVHQQSTIVHSDHEDPLTSVTTFEITDTKLRLKKALQKSFTIQWIKNELYWPKRFSKTQRNILPLQRAVDEMYRALYHKESNLRRKDDKGKYTVSINEGLFSRLLYKRDEVIATFHGITRTQEEYIQICTTEPWRRKYSICFSSNGDVLDCWEHYNKGLCLASYANSPRGCVDLATGKKAVDNCRLSVNLAARTMSLKCGVDVHSRLSPKTFQIEPDTELLWNYGDSFVGYDSLM